MSRSAKRCTPAAAAGGVASGEYSLNDVMTIVSRLVTDRSGVTRPASRSSVIGIPDPRVAHEILDLRRRVGRVDVDDDGAEPQYGEDADYVLRTIRQHHANAIAFDDAAERQRRGQAIGVVLQRAEGDVRAEERQGGQLVAFGRRAPQDLVERAARVIGMWGTQ